MLKIFICEKCNKELSSYRLWAKGERGRPYRRYRYNPKILVNLFKCDICSEKFKCQSPQSKKS